MKCDNCKKEVWLNMHYCPYCAYDLTNQISEYKKNEKKKSIIVLTIIAIIINALFGISKILEKINNKNELDKMVTTICNGSYDKVYTYEDFKDQGIYQCKDNSNVYYVRDLKEYRIGEIYELGNTKEEIVEKMFPNSIYFYKESKVTSMPNELRIALEANSEEDLINKYSEKLYGFIKNLNIDYKEDIQLIIFFNDSLSGVNSTYDKLFLMKGLKNQQSVMATQTGEYIFNDGDPYILLSTIFMDKNSYPTKIYNSIKKNRNINIKITDGKTITYDDFVERLRNSFRETY